jgi:hypothetical protein
VGLAPATADVVKNLRQRPDIASHLDPHLRLAGSPQESFLMVGHLAHAAFESVACVADPLRPVGEPRRDAQVREGRHDRRRPRPADALGGSDDPDVADLIAQAIVGQAFDRGQRFPVGRISYPLE